RDLQEDDFLLLAEQFDALDARHLEQFATQELDVAAQLRERVAVAGDGQEDAEHVAEVIDHHRPAAHRGRQARLHVGDLAPELVPDLGDAILVVALLDVDGDHRPAARRLRLDVVELAQLLAGVLDRVGDLPGHLLCAGAWVRRDDQGLLNRELRVLEPADLPVGHDAAQDGEEHGNEHDAVILDGQDAWVHGWPPPRASPRSRTRIPSRRKLTPATAMRSPGCNPSVTSTRPPVAAPSFTGRRVTVCSGPWTHTTCSPAASCDTAATGTRMRLPRMLARR